MKFRALLVGASLALGLVASGAQAAPIHFAVSSASADVTDLSVGADLTASAANAVGEAFQLTNVGDSYTFDFIDWALDPDVFSCGFLRPRECATGAIGLYTFQAAIAFDPPGGGGSASGGGGFFVAPIIGTISGGILDWGGPGFDAEFTVDTGTGLIYDVVFEGGADIFLGLNTTTSATVTLAAVPLPAGILLLLSGLGGIGVLRLRRKFAM